MKFQNKQTQYQSKKNPFPTYLNSYVRDGKIEIGENSEYLKLSYLFCHRVEQIEVIDEVETPVEKEVVINRSELVFTESHTPTIMTLENGDRVEVYEAILTGETYHKDKIKPGDWGQPDLHKVMTMFRLDSLTNAETGLVIKDLEEITVNGNPFPIIQEQAAQIKQLMLDWLGQKVFIENETLQTNFILE